MYERDGVWIMEGLEKHDPKRIKSMDELYEYIETVGFLPLFSSRVPGFSLEELTSSEAWFSGETEDPWEWRAIAAREGKVVYGKFFGKKAGFISKTWFPYFAAYRRDGYDFDTLYELGMASRKSKLLMDVLEDRAQVPSYELKTEAGFGKNGECGFDGAITNLMMQTYCVISGFERKLNKVGEEYGWPVAVYSAAEHFLGRELVRSQYRLTKEEARAKIMEQMRLLYPDASEKDIGKEI
jgi:hypothetical protein